MWIHGSGYSWEMFRQPTSLWKTLAQKCRPSKLTLKECRGGLWLPVKDGSLSLKMVARL